MNKTNKKTEIILIITIVAIFIIMIFISILSSLDFSPKNEETAVGNTAGNLYNSGYFCEYEDKVYFVYPQEQYQICVMSKDGTIHSLGFNNAFSLNIQNGYLYYSKNNGLSEINYFLEGIRYGLYRVNLKDNRSSTLSTSLCPYICISGNTIYFQEYTDTSLYFSKVDIKKPFKKERISDSAYAIACADNGYLYYTELEGNHNVYQYNTKDGRSSLFYSGNFTQCIYQDNTLYIIDVGDGYALKKVDMNTNEITVLTSDKCVNYNVYQNVVFYEIENPDTGRYGLYRNNTDGTNEELISSSPCMNINITSDYTYFQYFTDDSTLYRTPTFGEISVELFQPLIEEQ